MDNPVNVTHVELSLRVGELALKLTLIPSGMFLHPHPPSPLASPR